MHVWYHRPTISVWRRLFLVLGIPALIVAFITTGLFAFSSKAAPGINQTMSFQGRLLRSSGGVVPDGYYNMQFKIYQDGDGTQAGDTGGTGGSLKWTETYTNNGAQAGVQVSDGFFSVTLGSKTAFGSLVDWNSDTLWLSMNVAGTENTCSDFTSCSPDGEMLPMKRITSAPYAMNAGKLDGKTSDDFIHNSTDQQTGDFNISGTGAANILQGSTSVITPALDSDANGTITIGNANASTISIGTNNTNHTIAIGTGTGVQNITLGSTSSTSTVTINSGSGGVKINGNTTTSGSIIANGSLLSMNEGNYFGTGVSVNGATFSTNTNSIVLQGGSSGTTLITAINNSGVANIGIGNNASNGYALDVTGDTNISGGYRIGGNTTLTGSALTFSGAVSSAITSANGQSLTINGATGISLKTGGVTSATTSTTNIQIGSGSGSGTPIFLTLDKASSTPAGGSTPSGSMYYDTSLNAVQCFNGTSWGSCDTLPDTFISLTPEYAGAVLQGTGDGTLVSGLCSSDLNVNDGTSGQPNICGSNETYNYYDWSSTAGTSQDYGIYVSYQLPSTFSKFVAGSTSLTGKTSASGASISYQVYRKANGGAMTACGSSTAVASGASSWTKATATSTADPSSCGFAAGDTVYIKISMDSASGAHAYAGPISFAFSNAN